MECCQVEIEKSHESSLKSACCRSEKLESCKCNIKKPVRSDAKQTTYPTQKTEISQSVYFITLPDCVLCINPEGQYCFGIPPNLIYITAESKIFSGRSPPVV